MFSHYDNFTLTPISFNFPILPVRRAAAQLTTRWQSTWQAMSGQAPAVSGPPIQGQTWLSELLSGNGNPTNDKEDLAKKTGLKVVVMRATVRCLRQS